MKLLTEKVLALLLLAPILLTHDHEDEARRVWERLINHHHVPAEFIQLRRMAGPCRRVREDVSWQLCVDAGGDLQEVHADTMFIKETLGIFL